MVMNLYIILLIKSNIKIKDVIGIMLSCHYLSAVI